MQYLLAVQRHHDWQPGYPVLGPVCALPCSYAQLNLSLQDKLSREWKDGSSTVEDRVHEHEALGTGNLQN